MKPCIGCDGKGWMTLQPGNFIAPCLLCSSTKSLEQIEESRNMKLVKDSNDHWIESPLQ